MKAQIKISLINIYYILVGVLGLVALTYNEVKSSRAGVAEYFICESLGDPNTECHFGEEFVEVLKAFTLTVIMALSFLPVVVLIFIVDLQALKKLRPGGDKRKDRELTSRTSSSRLSYIMPSSIYSKRASSASFTINYTPN